MKMTKTKCANCDKELEVPESVVAKKVPVVCNTACFNGYISRIYEVQFCSDTKWICEEEESKPT
jgi:hypothetical protein